MRLVPPRGYELLKGGSPGPSPPVTPAPESGPQSRETLSKCRPSWGRDGTVSVLRVRGHRGSPRASTQARSQLAARSSHPAGGLTPPPGETPALATRQADPESHTRTPRVTVTVPQRSAISEVS